MQVLITQAVKLLANSGVVSLPTETVYSLSADARNDAAVQKIYQLKGRRQDNPLALLIGSVDMAEKMVNFNEFAKILITQFCPGALTLVLQKKSNTGISKFVNEDLTTLAVRMPAHAITLAILNACNFPVIGTSANPSGLPPATNAVGVYNYFADKIDLIIDGGDSDIGFASTIVDLTGKTPLILRQGAITAQAIEETLQCKVQINNKKL